MANLRPGGPCLWQSQSGVCIKNKRCGIGVCLIAKKYWNFSKKCRNQKSCMTSGMPAGTHFDKITEGALAADDLLAFFEILAKFFGRRFARIEVSGKYVIDGKQNENHHCHDHYHYDCLEYGYRHGLKESLQPRAAIRCYYSLLLLLNLDMLFEQ